MRWYGLLQILQFYILLNRQKKQDFYAKIKEGHHPKSSQPPIGEVVDVYEKYSGDDIINISMADGISGTYQSACMAKAQQMKEAGCSAKEIIDWVNTAIENQESFLIPQDFDFLRRGGRLTPMAAALSSVLRLKPIMTQTPDGKRLDKFGVKRTMGAAFKTVVDHMKEKQIDNNYIVYVSHAEAIKDARNAEKMVKEAFADIEVRILDLGAAFVTQGGPQCVAIQYIKK